MIYFVDEDVPYAKEFSLPLILRGFEVKIISNADKAIEVLETAENIQLVVLDIMLATGDAKTSKFSAGDTENFLTTGLLVIEYLSNVRSSIFPKTVVVLSSAGKVNLVSEITRVCHDAKIQYLKKSDYKRPADLADDLLKILSKT